MGLLKDITLCGIGFVAGYYVAKEFDFHFYDNVKRTIGNVPTTERRISELEDRVKFYEKLLREYIEGNNKELNGRKENGK